MNTNEYSISVCLATYNGEKYINEQVYSILKELGPKDEIIIVDDGSVDGTINVLQKYNDIRIKIFKNNQNRGHLYTFSRAIKLSTNDYIFFSDQDDIWALGRVEKMIQKLISKDKLVVSSNFSTFSEKGINNNPVRGALIAKDSNRNWSNIAGLFFGERAYYGCAMAFHSDLKKYLLPIPKFAQSHDLWLAIVANVLKTNVHLELITLRRRIHNLNVSGQERHLINKVATRIKFALMILLALYRKFSRKYW